MQLWEMPCQAVDLVLQGAFEWRELHNLLSSQGISADPCVTGLPLAEHALGVVHALCHRETPVARVIQKQLDHRYRPVRRRLAGVPLNELMALCLRRNLEGCPDLVAFLWALARDPRDETPAFVPAFVKRVQTAAVRALLARTP